jgi:cation diffusion facilitator CzcD-associated flavoprotein CzcO
MKIKILGAGPAGLHFAALMKRRDPTHDITVFERGPRDATWGVNAGEILQRLAGVKVQHGRKQEGPRYRGPSCLSRFIPEGLRPTAALIGLGVTAAWSERA